MRLLSSLFLKGKLNMFNKKELNKRLAKAYTQHTMDCPHTWSIQYVDDDEIKYMTVQEDTLIKALIEFHNQTNAQFQPTMVVNHEIQDEMQLILLETELEFDRN